jgi:hypothetical protein
LAKLASIVAILYLGMAPGMNVARLVHSLDLCVLFEQASTMPAHPCPDHQHDEPAPQDNGHHTHDFMIESGVLPVIAPPAAIADAPAYQLQVPLDSAKVPPGDRPHDMPERPPPLAPHISVTLLLI